MLSSSAFGATGPFRSYTGFHPHFASFGGLVYITGYPDGEPNTLTNSIDTRVGTTGAFAVLAALNYRDRTGKGQYIDLASTESLSVLIGDVFMDYTMNGRIPFRTANHNTIMAPHNCYRCKGEDKWISIAVSNDKEWKALCKAMGDPEWTKEEAFTDQYSRWQNQKRLDQLMGEWTIKHTHYEIMNLLQDVGVAAMPSFNDEEIFTDAHTKARDATTSVNHAVMGNRLVFNPPWKFSKTPSRIERASPMLGEHNEYVFSELLGISKQEIAKLVEEKVLY
jgi:benzylsuccinate CoA-transferase BbsF subunit